MDTNKISQNIKILINQFNAGNYENVISKGIVLIKKNPEYVILYNLVGSSFQKRGQFVEAAKNFKLGLKLDSKNLSLMNNLAMSYKNLLEFGLAEELYLKIIEANNKYINAYVNLGNLKRDLNKFDDAIKLYKQALDIDNNNPIIFYSLALAYQGIGDFDQTITYAQRALNINSNFTRADQLISQSINFKDHKEKYETLKKKIKDVTIQNFEKVDIYFCLAKAEEDLGNIKESSQYLIAGNKLKKELVKYNITEEINLLKDIKNNFKELSLKNIKSENDNIIFILGMPRSGTSLVEQIITSHSQVFGGG
ncbi:tetratricopeptide repeat protein [Candidatus Pelagibacter sp.]|nr:tetratricopeptide repeat protein [Candidatus Pelagibacter sp.]